MNKPENAMGQGRAALKRRPVQILIAILVLGFVISGLTRISFNIEILKLLPMNLRQVEGLSLFLKHFALPEELIVTIQAADDATAEAASLSLTEALQKHPNTVHQAVSRPPWEKSPSDLSELLAYMVANQAPERVQKLVENMAPDKAEATAAGTIEKLRDSVSPQEIALLSYDPFAFSESLSLTALAGSGVQSEFSSGDGTFRVIYVQSANRLRNYKQSLAWIKEVKRLANEWKGSQPLTLGFTGEPAFVAEISSSMEWDMMSSGFGTLLIVGAIFWLCYRRAKPLAYLMTMLVGIFILSLATAGLFLNQLTVMGVGFASIMIGLSVDYGYFIFQKSLHHTGSVGDLRKICFQNIAWTAGTTAAAFFALNLSSLPGLSQLGNLVGIGVVVGAIVMLAVFVPMAVRFKKVAPRPSVVERLLASPRVTAFGGWLSLLLIIGLSSVLFIKGPPGFDFSSRSLRPRHSEAFNALDQLQSKLTDESNLLSLIVTGKNAEEVRARLEKADVQLTAAVARGDAQSYRSSLPLWAAPDNQKTNLPRLAALAKDASRLKESVVAAGFTEDAFTLTAQMIGHWEKWGSIQDTLWPGNAASKWIFRRTIRHEETFLALGMVAPVDGKEESLSSAIQSDGVHLVSWNLLGNELQRVIPREFRNVFLGLIGIVFFMLIFGFRSLRDCLLLAITMVLVFISLAGAMTLLGMSWNFFNLAAILLLLGTGIDYGILLILALRENKGDVADAQRQLGLVIFLCAAAAAAGFGSISWANNLGLASLGKTCALGLVLDALISVFLLPKVWKLIHPGDRP